MIRKVFFTVLLLFLFTSEAQTQYLSKHIASYKIDVRLDIRQKAVEGSEILTWLNDSNDKITELYFHLYQNAFKNGKSTWMREGGTTVASSDAGWIDVKSIKVIGGESLMPMMQYVQPDDGNVDDQTVMKVALPKPVYPHETIKLEIEFYTKLPRAISRSCYAAGREFYFVSQWFPKIGVYQEGKGWNCHQYHRFTEFFADFGLYDVSMTVPKGYIVGATGVRKNEKDNGDGTLTYNYRQPDVHDFAWTASPEFVEFHRTFRHPSLPSTEMILLIQPEHVAQAERYFGALENAMKYFGEWYGEYPYPTITMVDPPRTSSSGGMEYPTLITVGTRWLQLSSVLSPENVTVHEFGHQYWYGMVANNEFEEAWLDEGFNSYSTGKVLTAAYGTDYAMFRIAGGIPILGLPLVTYNDFPIITYLGKVATPEPYRRKQGYLYNVTTDPIYKFGWKYYDQTTYRVGSYFKPEMVLRTLENYLGSELMANVVRTYYQRFRFKHPTTYDFINTVNEVTGKDMNWFFDQLIFHTGVADYEVSSISTRGTNSGLYETEVVLKRNGEVKFPVEVLITLEDGYTIRDNWDGEERWTKLNYTTRSPATLAQVDPENKIVLDIDFSNNSKRVEPDYRSTFRWASKFFLWMQHFLQIISSLC